jgi:hypothetical protein
MLAVAGEFGQSRKGKRIEAAQEWIKALKSLYFSGVWHM